MINEVGGVAFRLQSSVKQLKNLVELPGADLKYKLPAIIQDIEGYVRELKKLLAENP